MGKDWSSDPKLWLALIIVGGAATSVLTAVILRKLGLEAEAKALAANAAAAFDSANAQTQPCAKCNIQ